MISSLSAKNKMTQIAVEITRPNSSTNSIRTSAVTGDSLDSILRKITHRVIDDNCQDGINCMGGTMTGALDKVLSMLATRLGKTGSIGYKSIQKSEIKQQKFKLKLSDNSLELKDKEKISNKFKNENDQGTKQYNDYNILETEIQNTSTENNDDVNENDDVIEQDIEENEPTTYGVEYFVFGGNKIAALN